MNTNQIDMFETEPKQTPINIIYGRIETFEQKQKRHRDALLFWLQVTSIHAKPGQLLIEKDPSNGAWIDSWLIPQTRARILEDLGGMAAVW